MDTLKQAIIDNLLMDFNQEITGTDVLRHYLFNLSFEKPHVSVFFGENMKQILNHLYSRNLVVKTTL